MTRRRALSNMERLRLFLTQNGRCAHCALVITPGKRWDVDHRIPLALGGAHDAGNLQILCLSCHHIKTAYVDRPQIAKVKRMRVKHFGAARAKRPLPCGRHSPFKKTMDGKVVRRRLR